MKKYARICTVLIFLFILFRFFFLFIYRGRTVNYVLKEQKNKYYVHEEYIRNKKEISNHYYVEIQFDEIIFNFRISDDFDRKNYIIDTIYSFQNDQYTCILPIFSGDIIQTDILCKKGDMIYSYRHLQNESLALDKFATSMKEYGYLIDTTEEEISYHGISVLKNNVVSSHTVVIPSYKGVYLVNEDDVVSSIELFQDDVYTQPIQGVVSHYYIVADYDASYSFHTFKLIDLNTKKLSSITSDSAISMDSYVQGIVDNCLYIIDRSNRKQYKIDVANKTVTLVGNSKKGVLYYNGIKFETRSIYDALNSDLIFNLQMYDSSKYDYVYLFNGIYYSYLKTNDGYVIYISYEENPSLYSYALSIFEIDKIKYVEDFIYFIDKDTIYYYHPKSGVVKVLSYAELFYNSKLSFWIYKK